MICITYWGKFCTCRVARQPVSFRSFEFMQSKLFSHSLGSEMTLQVDLRHGFAKKLMLEVEGHGSIPSQISDRYSDSKDCFLEYGKAVIG
jgi:hypothetical protein